MKINYYLDESGNTGDLTLASPDFIFGEQPFFTLSCVGISDENNLYDEFTRLKKLHKIQAQELKFDSIKKKPNFLIDLLAYLKAKKSPILVEVTHKKYSLCIHIVECLIVPAVCPQDFGPKATFMKNVFADYLMANLPNLVLAAFCNACQTRTHSALKDSFEALNIWLKSCKRDEIIDGLILFSEDTQSDFLDENSSDIESLKRYLPVPDRTRSGKSIEILPHISSLTHIYGRLNRHHGKDLHDVTLYHDEQLQFDAALLDNMEIAESSVGNNLPEQPFADFDIKKPAQLLFAVSHEKVGIQVADLLAGGVSFLVNEFLYGNNNLHAGWLEVFEALFNDPTATNDKGIILVMPDFLRYRLFSEVKKQVNS